MHGLMQLPPCACFSLLLLLRLNQMQTQPASRCLHASSAPSAASTASWASPTRTRGSQRWVACAAGPGKASDHVLLDCRRSCCGMCIPLCLCAARGAERCHLSRTPAMIIPGGHPSPALAAVHNEPGDRGRQPAGAGTPGLTVHARILRCVSVCQEGCPCSEGHPACI